MIRTIRTGTRLLSQTMGPKLCSPTNGAVAWARAAVRTTRTCGAPTRSFVLKDDKLTFENYYKMPAAQGDTENCVAHNGSLVPVPGRDIEVQAWYQGGISVVDFTDAAHPFEIAYFDRGPIDPKMLVLGGDWSAYWYNGYIYASEIARGLDVFELTPTKFLTQNEIDAAKTVRVSELNVQNQQKIEWPANWWSPKHMSTNCLDRRRCLRTNHRSAKSNSKRGKLAHE